MVKLEKFANINRFRDSSVGVQIFASMFNECPRLNGVCSP